jgi:hypothetical protein
MAWTGEHRAFVVEAYFKNSDSVIATQRQFRTHFIVGRHGRVPDKKTILLWVRNFRQSGSTLKQKSPGRRRSVRTPENIAIVKHAVLRSPRRSALKQALALGISDRSFRRILHLDLKFHPYKIMVVQELLQRDWLNRQAACETILKNVPCDAVVLTSDEAHFHLSGYVNKQNFRYWARQNPRELHQRPLHSERVTVWCAVAQFGLIGPYFFEEEGRTVTVTCQRYVKMLRDFLQPRINDLGNTPLWFQQDGATAHTANESRAVLRGMFPGRLISQRGDIAWPARSPDLSPCDYFLWGYLKAEVFKHRPRTIEELKDAIRSEITAIPEALTRRALQNFRVRLQECITREGKHLDDILFKTK